MADVAGEQAPRRFKVAGEGLELTITLDAKWQARPFQQAVALPFVKKFNSQQREGGRQLSVEALCGVQIDGAGLSRVADARLAAAGLVVPPAASRVELTFGESPPTELRLRVACGDVSVKLTLDKRWLGKTVAEAVVKPFLSVYNRRQPTATPPRTPEQAVEIHADGAKLPSAKEALRMGPLEALGWHCTRVDLFFSYEAVRAAAKPRPMLGQSVGHMSTADYREATELLWTHRKLNKADGAAIARSFTAASPLRKLKYLYLYGNSLGDEGLAALAPALRREHAPALRELHLSTNGIGSEGVRALAELCHPSPKLAALSLHDNRISDEGVFALADAISGGSFVVEKVTLHTNPAVSAEGVRRMTEACAGADFAEPTPDRGPTPYIPLDHTPQRWLERGDVDK